MKTSFLGGGNMARALIGGLLAQNFPARDIFVLELNADNRQRLQAELGIRTAAPTAAAIAECGQSEVLVLAVKPQQMQEALASIVTSLDQALVISIAAGLQLADLSRWLGGYRHIVRAMPNTPALIGAGITGLCALPEVTAPARREAEQILQAVGETLWFEDESAIDAVTAVSGSGPAYFFLFIEALQQAGQNLGLTAAQARQLAVATAAGAAQLAAQSTEDLAVLRERVTSKGGTTEAALNAMQKNGVAAGIIAGVQAAAMRSRELGNTLGQDK